MSGASIRPAFSTWPDLDRRLRDAVAGLTEEQLARAAGPDRWPLWAIVGHLACQRVFWLCDFAGAPGADRTRFTNAAFDCPGDDDLENVMDAPALVEALRSTFAIVEDCLDTWTIDALGEVISHPDWGDDWVKSRGAVIQRVFAHDVWHVVEVNEILAAIGLPAIDAWS